MSFLGRGSYFAAAAAGVASAFYIFEPEFKEMKRQRDSPAPAAAASAPTHSAAACTCAQSAAAGRWQELTSRDGKVYWMNLDTGTFRALFVQRGGIQFVKCVLVLLRLMTHVTPLVVTSFQAKAAGPSRQHDVPPVSLQRCDELSGCESVATQKQ